MTSETFVQSSRSPVSYPAAPWQMVGSMWLSLFHLGHDVDETRPKGIYGAAFVSYEEGSPLTYSELLVARPVPARDGGRGRKVSITDIWVDSPASVAGGRELWAIPKGLCDFRLESTYRGPLTSTDWAATLERRPIAAATFTDVSRMVPRLPFKGSTWQPGIEDTDGEDRGAVLQGSAKSFGCRGSWDFAPDGPLGWLEGARQLASFRMSSFRMSFG